MQKFILIRGHQGSGKSTFAEQKAAEFKTQYPDAEVVRIENDVFITDEYGEYRWSGEAVVVRVVNELHGSVEAQQLHPGLCEDLHEALFAGR